MAFVDVYADVISYSHVSGKYDHLNSSYKEPLVCLLPTGPAWTFEENSTMLSLLEALSYSFLRVYQRGLDLLEEYDPRTTFELLEDWERVLDLPGTNPTPPTTLVTRRAAIWARLLGCPEPNVVSFTAIATALGYVVVILSHPYDCFVAGSPAGYPLRAGSWAYLWEVFTWPGVDDDLLEWSFDNITPNHTDQVFHYYLNVEKTNAKNFNLNDIAYDGTTYWVIVGNADGTDAYLLRSNNGDVWMEQANPKNFALNDVCHCGTFWLAVGAADGGDAYIVTSPTGVVWTEQANPKNFALYGVAWNGSNLAVAVGQEDGVNAYLITSPDGAVWTEQLNPKNFLLRGVAFGGGLWVAVGIGDGVDAYIITSPDGANWTERANPKNFALYGVAYHDGIWVAVGSADGSDAYIVRSTNGIDWFEQTNLENRTLYDVAWGNGEFVAVGNTGTTDAYMLSSTDGITWVERPNPKNSALYGLAFGNYRWIAVGSADGVDGYIAGT